MRNWNVQFVWRPRYVWLGAFWVRTGNCMDVYINFLPCVSLHVSWWGLSQSIYKGAV